MHATIEKIDTLQDGDLDQQFAHFVKQFQLFLSRNGINKRAFSDGGLENFKSLPRIEKERYFKQLRDYYLVCQDLESEGLDTLRNPKKALESLSFRLDISVPDEFIDQLTGEEIVEIYDFEGNQLYRNLTFFEISDYTIDDFFGRSWDYLYERSSAVTNIIIQHIEKVAKMKSCMRLEGPTHYMRERATANRKIVKVTFGYISPVLRDGTAVAWIASTTAQEVIPKTSEESECITFI